MVTVRRPDVTRYRDGDGKLCSKSQTDNSPKGESTGIYHFRFTYRKKRIDISTGCRKEKQADRAAHTLQDLVERYRCGEHIEVSEIRSDAGQEMFLTFLRKIGKVGEHEMAQARDKPWEDSFEGYLESLKAKGDTPKYIKGRIRDVTKAAAHCQWKVVRDLEQVSKVNGYLIKLRKKGLSGRTINEVVRALRGFGNFLTNNGYLAKNPFLTMETCDEIGVNPRRILTDKEFDTLLATAKASEKTIHRLTGPMRFTLYLLARATGYRCSELASLAPENFVFDGRPRVWVSEKVTKNRKPASQPLCPDMVTYLEKWLSGRPKGEKLFLGSWYRLGSKIIQVDLEDAGIEFKTAEGKYDFHCLRHQHSTSVQAASPSERVAREVTRHADSKVADRYSHFRDGDKRKVIDAMSVPKALQDELDS